MEKKDVFISYSRKDTKIADRICAAFDRAGITYFIDRQGIGGGMEFPIVLAKAITECKLFLFLASTNSYESKFTNSEVTFAFNEKPKNCLLPYIIDKSDFPLEMRFIFSSINWRNLIDHPIDTVLVDDVCRLLGKEKKLPYTSKESNDSTTKPHTDESAEELFNEALTLDDNKEFEKAFGFYLKSAELGYAPGQRCLGYCYNHGEGVSKDYAEAVKWYRKAAEQGDAVAQYNLGRCHYNGEGVSKDYVEAVKWCRKAADQGNAVAQYYLGRCHYNGEGVSKDYVNAVKWFRKAADQGNVAAQCILGCCYEEGTGVPNDYSEAVKWYRKAAEQGDAAAQYNLGCCYEEGTGVPNDYSEAVKWYRKAAEQGDADAKSALKKILSSITNDLDV